MQHTPETGREERHAMAQQAWDVARQSWCGPSPRTCSKPRKSGMVSDIQHNTFLANRGHLDPRKGRRSQCSPSRALSQAAHPTSLVFPLNSALSFGMEHQGFLPNKELLPLNFQGPEVVEGRVWMLKHWRFYGILTIIRDGRQIV